MTLRICPVCVTVEDIPTNGLDLCPHCLARGHTYRRLAEGDFDRSRAIWATHPILEVVAIALAAIDKAERSLAEAAAMRLEV